MFQGVVHCIGSVLSRDWNAAKGDNKRSLASARLSELKRVFDFRDQFAHPKIIRASNLTEADASRTAPIPAIGWEPELGHVEANFQRIQEYAELLPERAAKQLQEAYEPDDFGRITYPHLENVQLEAAYLRALLGSSFFSFSSYSS